MKPILAMTCPCVAGAEPQPTPEPTSEADLQLLRAYEPIARFAKGELFFPTAVGPYVSQCSLWRHEPTGDRRCIAEAGDLSLEDLCREAVARQDRPLSLRFVAAPLTRDAYRRWRRAPRERLVAGARFTTTGMFGRLVEAGLRASLLLRGKVAAGLAAAAEIAYRERLESDRMTYYGRVVRTGGYICLQYWYFYAMNDWRSTFSGVNDHEADWEMAMVYLAEISGAPARPAWVAFSSHDHAGDALRRRWDDPDLTRSGDHPVLFPAAGSHSGAFIPGDYVVSVDPPQLRQVIAAARRAQRLLSPWRDQTRPGPGLGIPFIDYARGDGRAVGPGQSEGWTARLIDDDTPWVRDYRGLWGLDTEDHFGGERAPAGPRYERDGAIRHAWSDPLGWAGLLKVPPGEHETAALLRASVANLEESLRDADAAIAAQRTHLRRVAAEVRSLEAHDFARPLVGSRRVELQRREAELARAIAERAGIGEELRAHRDEIRRPSAPVEPHAHLSAQHAPRPEEQQRRMRFLRLWAAVSTPLLLASIPVILLARPLGAGTAVVVLVLLFAGGEAFARRRLLSFAASVLLLVVTAAVVVGLVELSQQHWELVISLVCAVAAGLLLVGNLGDLTHGWRQHASAGREAERQPPDERGSQRQ